MSSPQTNIQEPKVSMSIVTRHPQTVSTTGFPNWPLLWEKCEGRAERIVGPLVTAKSCRKRHHAHTRRKRIGTLCMPKVMLCFQEVQNPEGTWCELQNKDACVSDCALWECLWCLYAIKASSTTGCSVCSAKYSCFNSSWK